MRASFFGLIRYLDDLAERVIFDLMLRRWRWRTLLVSVLAAVCLMGGSRPAAEPAATPAIAQDALEGGKLLFKRAWIDRKPKQAKDHFSMYGFSEKEVDSDLYLGFSVNGIAVKYMVEVNGFKVKGDKLHFWFPADDSNASTGFKVTREKNGEFDLKLVIERDPCHGGKSHTYYSRMDGRSVVPGLSLSPDLEGCIGTVVR